MWFSVQGTYWFRALLQTQHYDFWYTATVLIILQINNSYHVLETEKVPCTLFN